MRTSTVLEQHLARVMDADPGLYNLSTAGPLPELPAAEVRRIRTWASVLAAIHGHAGAARAYSSYVHHRSRAMADRRITSWDHVVQRNAVSWSRDRLGFLCVGCGSVPPSVMNAHSELMCRECARMLETLETVSLAWRGAAHSVLAYSGPEQGEPRIAGGWVTVDWAGGETTSIGTGDAGPLFNPAGVIPGLESTMRVPGTQQAFHLEVTATTAGGVSLTADFDYDHRAERLTFASGLVAVDGAPAGYSDLFGFYDAVITAATKEADR